jgi:hypothetical protein
VRLAITLPAVRCPGRIGLRHDRAIQPSFLAARFHDTTPRQRDWRRATILRAWPPRQQATAIWRGDGPALCGGNTTAPDPISGILTQLTQQHYRQVTQTQKRFCRSSATGN